MFNVCINVDPQAGHLHHCLISHRNKAMFLIQLVFTVITLEEMLYVLYANDRKIQIGFRFRSEDDSAAVISLPGDGYFTRVTGSYVIFLCVQIFTVICQILYDFLFFFFVSDTMLCYK